MNRRQRTRQPRGNFLHTLAGWTLYAAAAAGLSLIAPAAQAQDSGSHGNIFSPPPDEAAGPPSFVEGKGRRQAQAMLGAEIPGFEQVRMIPSLNGQQQQQIRRIYQSSRSDIQPLAEQLRALRRQLNGAGQASQPPGATTTVKGRLAGAGKDDAGAGLAMPNADGGDDAPANDTASASPQAVRAHMKELAQEVKSKRQAVWEQVKAVLTDEQLQEFEDMRKGRLMLPGVRNERSN